MHHIFNFVSNPSYFPECCTVVGPQPYDDHGTRPLGNADIQKCGQVVLGEPAESGEPVKRCNVRSVLALVALSSREYLVRLHRMFAHQESCVGHRGNLRKSDDALPVRPETVSRPDIRGVNEVSWRSSVAAVSVGLRKTDVHGGGSSKCFGTLGDVVVFACSIV